MKAFIIKDEFRAGDCWDCPLALANLNECAHDDYCPLYDVEELHCVRGTSKTMYNRIEERDALEAFLENSAAKYIGEHIKKEKLCTISSCINPNSDDYEKKLSVLIVKPKEEIYTQD